ncbi:MAG: hypothetical protein Q4A74_01970 [Cardiobacteriaceae bacterium]|nr:hypothetical protein [Cardiobacteriaceae bacterium]
MKNKDLFVALRPLRGSQVIEAHCFPLFELTGLYQKLSVPLAGILVESVLINLEEAADCEVQYLLDLVVASGYVAEDADLTFRESRAEGFLYTYFNIRPLAT